MLLIFLLNSEAVEQDARRASIQSRQQFGRWLADFQGLRWMLADMAVDLDAARLLIDRAASNAGSG